jgi:hypothetical protein
MDMRKYLLALTLVCALMVPVAAQGLPRSATAYGNVGRWANLTTVAYWSFPTSTTLKVTSASVTVAVTHVGVHEVKCINLHITKGSTLMYNAVTSGSIWILGPGSSTHSFYPDLTLPRSTVNRAGTHVHLVCNGDAPVVGCDLWSPWYWTDNFLD